ncbi:DUF4169 family protein [Limobrevibacterium gyesilva]|uniref:DUF4169 family protein n=1 Tax=Limobrevibacterium gyesilva TaxID=2991712 RepID=A0AA42CK84_9PROT|nr:DUF4169 family protein [Limobrevibacterium gyesilva]MCW3477575.1 DUF4169 family protein [Limobrevibacterium gyesilva]
MAEIVNLRQARKRQARAEADAAARENRVRHGRTGAQKVVDRGAEERRRALLDGARLPAPEPDKGS